MTRTIDTEDLILLRTIDERLASVQARTEKLERRDRWGRRFDRLLLIAITLIVSYGTSTPVGKVFDHVRALESAYDSTVNTSPLDITVTSTTK